MRTTALETGALVLAGALLSALAALASGRPAPADVEPLLASLAAQVPVHRWTPEDVRARDGAGLVVVDGRAADAQAGGRPAGAVAVPFERRGAEVFRLPEGRQVESVVVVLDAGRAAEARELAQWLAREWGVPEVATLRGGFAAWRAAGLPEERP